MDVAVSEQPLNDFRVCADTDQEGCQRMPQVVEAKPAGVVGRENPDLDRCWPDIVLNQNAGTARLLTLHPGTGENPISRLRVWRRLIPVLHEPCKKRMHGNRSLGRRALGLADLACDPRATNRDCLIQKIHVLPLQSEALGNS